MIDRTALIAAREASGLSQPRLAEMAKCSQQLISALESGSAHTTKFLPKIAAVLNVPPGKLDPDFADLQPSGAGIFAGRDLTAPGNDFGIHASAEGGPGEIIVSSDPVDFMPRPAPLIHVKDAYGLLITGTSMEPEFRQGDIALINPHLPVLSDETHVFYAEREGEARATIKHLRRATADKWLISQHNPQREFMLTRKEWRWAHRVLGKYSRR